ncbi:zinc finger BED domain-containing protein 5-like [Diorhabda carinulata]|uniref:zinc finger BED domain-containing protein 5-like n=1 Tax=Diorhabda carinulata TaxID=1163345 RepID=UPI0025A0847D|nr:zinc finger BED domain-containing protein 5-like [Diorhabda carinulata]
MENWLKSGSYVKRKQESTNEDFHELTVDPAALEIILEHLRGLSSEPRRYFPPILTTNKWIQNPFDEENSKNANLAEDALIEISCDSIMKTMFKEKSLTSFWLNVKPSYPGLFEKAMRFLIVFSTTYLCEHTKNKYRNRLDVESDLRLKISNFNLDIQSLVQSKQCQKSH